MPEPCINVGRLNSDCKPVVYRGATEMEVGVLLLDLSNRSLRSPQLRHEANQENCHLETLTLPAIEPASHANLSNSIAPECPPPLVQCPINLPRQVPAGTLRRAVRVLGSPWLSQESSKAPVLVALCELFWSFHGFFGPRGHSVLGRGTSFAGDSLIGAPGPRLEAGTPWPPSLAPGRKTWPIAVGSA